MKGDRRRPVPIHLIAGKRVDNVEDALDVEKLFDSFALEESDPPATLRAIKSSCVFVLLRAQQSRVNG